MIREKRQASGPLLEVDFYPTFADGRRMPGRAPRTRRTTAEQAKYNRQQAIKQLIRKINTNFDNTDYLMSPTYEQKYAPATAEQARRHMVNYLRRVKTRRASVLKEIEAELAELPDKPSLRKRREKLQAERDKLAAPFKYCYVIEEVTYKTGSRAGQSNFHFHLFLTGGLPRRELEELWPHGMRTNVDRYQPERFGPEAAAKYMCKDPRGSKRFVCSRNMDKPEPPKVKDGHISKRGVELLARQRVDDAEYWERRYKGYTFVRCYARYNEYNGHWYVSAVMYRKDAGAPPPWNIDSWIDDP